MTDTAETAIEHGVILDIPLNKLKASPRNARRTPHGDAAIEALAASIAVKGVLQAPVVEPETDEAGAPTGAYLVTIGEGRRLALRLLAKRKRIKKTEPVRCVVDTAHDPHEISLDENVTRSAMHPADEFEAFKALAEERGLGAEEIGARFGVSAHVVRQRLRLGAVSPKLMKTYRGGDLTLDQLMAFAVSEDHERQEQVFEQLSWNRSAPLIRRAMTEAKVPASDRRAVFVAEAYAEAGGRVLRDLFTEDGGGWLEDVALLERLAAEKLEALAREVRAQEGWKWAEAYIDYPHAHGFSRVYPHAVERSAQDKAAIAALGEEYDALLVEWDGAEDLPPEVEARFSEIDAALQAYGDGTAFGADDLARGGVFVVLDHSGQPRLERGLIRPQDAKPAPQVEPAAEGDADGDVGGGVVAECEEPEGDPAAPLPDRLVMDLTAHRTMALRNALASDPATALAAVVHSLALFAFYSVYDRPTCVEIGAKSASLEAMAPGIADSIAGRQIADRHEAWAVRLPKAAADLWTFVSALPGDDLLALLAHLTGLTINAVANPMDRRPGALAHADVLAETLELDMTAYWSATASSYLGRVTKAKIAEAVAEGVSVGAADRIADLKKTQMVETAEHLLSGRGWLPKPLRRAGQTFEPLVRDEEGAEGVAVSQETVAA
jgi:ParB family chromosome partitioning protein